MEKGRTKASHLVTLAVLALAVFANAMAAGFVYDDHLLVEGNPLVTGEIDLHRIFQTNYWGDQANHGLYRPLTTLSFAVDHALFGPTPIGYHAVNLVLHAGAVIALYLLILRLFRSPTLAFAASCVFALHPVHTEAVTWVVGRPEILACLFATISILLALPPLTGNRMGLSLVFFLLALLSKENAIVAIPLYPLALLLGDNPRGAWRRAEGYVPLLCMTALAAFWFVLRARVAGSIFTPEGYEPPFVVNPLGHVDRVERWATACAGVGKSLRLLILPVNLSVDYSFDQIPIRSGFLSTAVLIPATAVAGMIAAACVLRRGSPAVPFGIGWFLISILPASNLPFAVGTIFAERLLYLPSAGFCLLVAVLLERLRGAGDRGRRIAGVGLASVCLLLAAGTVSRNRDWQDDGTLLSSAVENAPRSAKARYELGRVRRDRDRDEEAAKRLFLEATEIYPGYSEAHYDRGNIYRLQGEYDIAITDFRRAIEADPEFAPAHHNLGLSLAHLGHLEGAAESLAEAIRLQPQAEAAWWDLAGVYAGLDRWEDAAATLEALLEVAPSNKTAHLRLAEIYLVKLKDRQKAEEHARAAQE